MAIYVTGDTHGFMDRIEVFDKKLIKGDICIVCGDFGYLFLDNDIEHRILDNIEKRPYTLAFVDGNHECFPVIYSYPKEIWNNGFVHRIRKNIIHLCRGQVFEIEHKKIFTFGGGYSVYRALRREGYDWWPQEMPTDDEFNEAERNLNAHDRKVNYIITHAAPEDTMNLFHPEHAKEKPLNTYLEYLRETITYDHWFMGHLHQDKDLWRNQSILWYDIRKID